MDQQQQHSAQPVVLTQRDFHVGKLLGEGEFCHVHEVQLVCDGTSFGPKQQQQQEEMVGAVQQRSTNPAALALAAMPRTTTTTTTTTNASSNHPNQLVVLKRLKSGVSSMAVWHLVTECRILSGLCHPNIVRLKATVGAITNDHESSDDDDDNDGGFGLVLERLLETTLEEKIRQDWTVQSRFANRRNGNRRRSKTRRRREGSFNIIPRHPKHRSHHQNCNWEDAGAENHTTQNFLNADRLCVLYEISNAMNYLHDKGILFRDLKPSNVGFDQLGRAKLFDFGLAKAASNDNDAGHDGIVGSLRYTAPEVQLGRPYSKPSDVYSFGILFWQVASLRIPYGNHLVVDHPRHRHDDDDDHATRQPFFHHVVELQKRPPILHNNNANTNHNNDNIPTTTHDNNNNNNTTTASTTTNTATSLSWLSKRLCSLIQECWTPNPGDRPNFHTVRRELEEELLWILNCPNIDPFIRHRVQRVFQPKEHHHQQQEYRQHNHEYHQQKNEPTQPKLQQLNRLQQQQQQQQAQKKQNTNDWFDVENENKCDPTLMSFLSSCKDTDDADDCDDENRTAPLYESLGSDDWPTIHEDSVLKW